MTWKERQRCTSDKTAIEDYCEKSIITEAGRWRKILTSIAEIIMFCAKNNLALRGHTEEFDQRDNGVFLSTFELLAKHDSILQEHIEKHKKGTVSYLSHTIQDELIELMGNHVKQQILSHNK